MSVNVAVPLTFTEEAPAPKVIGKPVDLRVADPVSQLFGAANEYVSAISLAAQAEDCAFATIGSAAASENKLAVKILKTPLASALFNNLLTEIILFNGFIEMAAYTTLEHNSSNTTSRIGYLVLPDYK
jgi:hypothetical protein